MKEQANKTSAEASNLAATRKIPDTQAANGQELTHYHSFFYSLLAVRTTNKETEGDTDKL